MTKLAESYIKGFTKVADSYGVDSKALIKYAAENKGFRNALGEFLGSLGGSTIGGGAIGTGIGALASILSRGKIKLQPALAHGMMAGTLTSNLANIGSSIAALFTKRRTKDKQSVHDSKGRFLLNTFIPGVGTYNMWKRLGSTFSDK